MDKLEELKPNSCDNCVYAKSPECPWEGSYHHKEEHGGKIGICNAHKKQEERP